MAGVNYELAPLVQMSVPEDWASTSIAQWPVDVEIFASKILLLGVIPIDLHHIKFDAVDQSGFRESSRSLMYRVWAHERRISEDASGARVKDTVYFECHLALLGGLLKPIYKAVFAHRHQRLRSRYGDSR